MIPVFALGRAQELLLILDEYWQDHPLLQVKFVDCNLANLSLSLFYCTFVVFHPQNVPIFYASKLATKSLRVYQTFINMMNNHVRDLMDQFNNPFKLKHIKSIHNNDDFAMLGPCVVMASPGFMQSGVSRQLFEAWCDDARHGVVIAGYTIEGTLANDLLSAPTEIKCLDNRIKPLRCQVEHISFSAHVDYSENKRFIKSVMPDYIILVHGEKTQMKRLKEGLEADMRKNLWPTHHKPSVAMPENGVKVKLRFRKNILADVVGSAATGLLGQLEKETESKTNNEGGMLGEFSANQANVPENALLVTENFSSKLVAASELANHTTCKFGRIKERLTVPIPAGLEVLVGTSSGGHGSPDAASKVVDLLMCHLEEVFDDLALSTSQSDSRAPQLITVQSAVTLSVCFACSSDSTSSVDAMFGRSSRAKPTHVLIEWSGSPITDTVADCVAGLVLQAFSAFNTLRRTMCTTATGAVGRSSRHKRRKAETQSASPTSSKGAEETKDVDGNVEIKSELVQQMMKGELDPSKKIKTEHATDPKKLKALVELLSASPSSAYFSEVKINADGDKLIFRSLSNTSYSVDESTRSVAMVQNDSKMLEEKSEGVEVHQSQQLEAFVFVEFNGGENGNSDNGSCSSLEHHAAVHCEDEAFRRTVMLALKLV